MTNNDKHYRNALPEGSMLEEFRLIKVLGDGGFGITYLAEDTTLEQEVAIKEYLPNDIAVREGSTVHPKTSDEQGDYAWGLERFEQEAKTLARFRHPNLVQVRRFFRGNNTAYMVMEYEDGRSLDKLIEGNRTLEEADIVKILLPLLDGLEVVHAAGVLHRDIKPANIYIRRKDESPVLLDFGAARQAIGRRSKSMTSVVSPGYSPLEQYESEGEEGQGPWSDIYSLGAVCYRVITGKTAPEATSRARAHVQGQEDPLRGLAGNHPGYQQKFLQAIDHSLRMRIQDRPQSIEVWREELGLSRVGPAMTPESESRRQASMDKGGRGRLWRKVLGVILLVAAVAGYMVWNQGRVEKARLLAAFNEELSLAERAIASEAYGKAETHISQAQEIGLSPERIARVKEGLARAQSEKAAVVEAQEKAFVKWQEASTLAAKEGDYGKVKEYLQELQEMNLGQIENPMKPNYREKLFFLAIGGGMSKGSALEKEGKYGEALAAYEGVVELSDLAGYSKEEVSKLIAKLKKLLSEPPTSPVQGSTWTDSHTGVEFVWVPAGRFEMGSPEGEKDRYSDEGPEHEVSVSGFWLGRHEVTKEEWERFIEATGYRTDAEENRGGLKGCSTLDAKGSRSYTEGKSWRDPGFAQEETHPVVCVSHDDVGKYLEWGKHGGRSYRLPTEAEWEYAAHGGSQPSPSRYWGDDADQACGYANVADQAAKKKFSSWSIHNCDDGYAYTAPVGHYQANGFGLKDMLGNVWEWCSDWYHDTYAGAPADGRSWETPLGSDRVLRGGSWSSIPAYVRAASRNRYEPAGRNDDLGFRLVLPPGQ